MYEPVYHIYMYSNLATIQPAFIQLSSGFRLGGIVVHEALEGNVKRGGSGWAFLLHGGDFVVQ